MDKILLASPHMSKEGYEMAYIDEAFKTNWIAPLGENVNLFEKEVASYVGVNRAAALSSGTSAIHLSLKASGIQKGDIVFCQSLTFAASANPIIYEGAIPVFIDSENESWNMDPKALEIAFKKYPNAKAVVVVNLYGNPAKLNEIKAICDVHGAILIEDAAESLGSIYFGKQTGTFGKYGIFSFNGNKIITASGGGMVVSNDEERINKIVFWSTQAKENKEYYEHKEIGYNYRLSNICAGIGRGQLKVLNERVLQKTSINNFYKSNFNPETEIDILKAPKDSIPNHWLSVGIIKNDKYTPEDIMHHLKNNNIESRRIWKPMHMQPVFKDYDFIKASDTCVSEEIFERGICLPSDTKMSKEEQKYVIDEIKKVF